MHFWLLIVVLFLCGCENKLDKLTECEVYDEANRLFNDKRYSASLKFYEHFENKYPLSSNIKESMYKRAVAYYKKGAYANAIAAFEEFVFKYPTDGRVAQAHRYVFFCYYNQMSRFDRDYTIIEKALESAATYKEFYIEDEEFKIACKRLEDFVVYRKLSLVHRALDHDPKLFASVLVNATDVIRNHPSHKFAPEAYYRVIEFLIMQKNEKANADAKEILIQMQKYHADSEWFKKAQAKINKARVEVCVDFHVKNVEEVDNDDVAAKEDVPSAPISTIRDDVAEINEE